MERLKNMLDEVRAESESNPYDMEREAAEYRDAGDHAMAYNTLIDQGIKARARIAELEEELSNEESRSGVLLGQRNEVLKGMTEVMALRTEAKDGKEGQEEAWNNAVAIVEKYRKLIADGDELTDLLSAGVENLLKMASDHGAGMVTVKGSTEDGEVQWVIIAALDATAESLVDWAKVDYDSPLLMQYAESAYKAYGRTVDNKNFRGDPMPAWSDLPEKIQEAWKSAALDVTRLVVSAGL